ncbi:hypothetical protein NDU88_004646 [Pleurodeles waltl]|uniref:Uncharacterized protein n=1 Tax=Pleurodeles waltl TaxID=8319 RepID=A0AAV7SJJ7_PLEWA|nr:hypothetical protein NDU88_004646 [Pleurodeles waltl]
MARRSRRVANNQASQPLGLNYHDTDRLCFRLLRVQCRCRVSREAGDSDEANGRPHLSLLLSHSGQDYCGSVRLSFWPAMLQASSSRQVPSSLRLPPVLAALS